MSKNQKKLYINLFILIVIFIFFFIYKKETKIEKSNSAITIQTTQSQRKVGTLLLNQGGVRGGNSVSQKTESVTVSVGDITINLQTTPNTSFYDILTKAKDTGKITFSGKNYFGMGFFVTDIGSLHAGNGKNLLYYINGKEAQVGISSYIPKDSDIVEWKLE